MYVAHPDITTDFSLFFFSPTIIVFMFDEYSSTWSLLHTHTIHLYNYNSTIYS